MLLAWLWLKKHWEAMAGLGIAVLGFIVGVEVKKRPVIVAGEDPDKKKIEDQTKAAENELQVAHDKQVAELEAEHSDSVAAVVHDEQKAEPEIAQSNQAVNDYLKNVGDEVRKDSK